MIVGLEVHAQLHTSSKLFCSCPTSENSEKPWVKDYLEKKKAEFKFVEHGLAMRCIDSARERNLDVRQIAKAMVYVGDGMPVLFILSGNRKIDSMKASIFLGSKSLKIASPEEVYRFTGCQLGAVPPTIDGIRKVIDKKLLDNAVVSFNAGTHTTGIIIAKKELLKILDNYEEGDISADEEIREAAKETSTAIEKADYSQPNSRVCEICLGFPGSKPSLNKKALDYGLKVALALNCQINKEFFFSRKTYFYPDLAKDFQITQYEIPVGENGYVELDSGKKIRIRRVHLEEDPASLVHGAGISSSAFCLIDYNRSGIPLVEIVTEPDMSDAAEAREFLNKLLNLLQYLEIFALGEDILKCDTNISFDGSERVEIKNVSGFKNVERALCSEAERQKKELSEGKKIPRETRGFNEEDGSTYSLRSKETEEDYGYIFEPDLSKIEVDGKWLSEIKKQLPELPEQKAKRFVSQYKMTGYEAKVICSEYDISKFYEDVAKKADPQLSAKFISRELLGILNYNDLTLHDSGMKAEAITDLISLIEQGKVSEKNAKLALIKYALEKILPKDYLRKENLLMDASGSAVEDAIASVLKQNPSVFADYKASPDKVINFVTGQVMRLTKGKADPRTLMKAVKEKLGKS